MPEAQKFLFGSIIFSRVIYAMCWFNLTAAFPAMQEALHYSLPALAVLVSAFLLGAGLFQVPAGVISAHRGATKTTLIGLLIIGIASLGSAATGDFSLQAILRFATGFGAAFFFSPGLIVVSNTLGENRSGLTLGLYNGAFNAGALVAVFVFTQISETVGWWLPFLITGLLSLACFAENWYAFRVINDEVKVEFSRVKSTLFSKDIWFVIAAMVGVNSAFYTVAQLSVTFTEKTLGFSSPVAATISALIFVGAVFGAPVGGVLGDRMRNRRLFTTLPAIAVSLVVGLLAFPRTSLVWIVAPLIGLFSSAAFTNSYAFATEYPEIGRKYAPLAVGLINSVGILEGGIATSLFVGIVIALGYPVAWGVLALTTVIFGPLVYLAREPFALKEKTMIEKKDSQ